VEMFEMYIRRFATCISSFISCLLESRSASFFESHRALLYCFVSLFVVGIMVVFPLTKDCRERRRQRRHAEEIARRARERRNPSSRECTPLLLLDEPIDTYGAGS